MEHTWINKCRLYTCAFTHKWTRITHIRTLSWNYTRVALFINDLSIWTGTTRSTNLWARDWLIIIVTCWRAAHALMIYLSFDRTGWACFGCLKEVSSMHVISSRIFQVCAKNWLYSTWWTDTTALSLHQVGRNWVRTCQYLTLHTAAVNCFCQS